ncbi:MAG TPA: hypothetical protein VKV23_07105 [Acidimicrobiales bacterium]|nr:hypothetical protein [Acidimicrobiales bacterium]
MHHANRPHRRRRTPSPIGTASHRLVSGTGSDTVPDVAPSTLGNLDAC